MTSAPLLRLIVLRHAKSDWDAGAHSDHERPLNARGRREAPIVGGKLREHAFVPELVLSSDATRTTQTIEAMRAFFPGATVRFERELYLAGLSVVRRHAQPLGAAPRTLMVVGHNPGWEEMVSELSGELLEMKTGYAAVLESGARDWAEALAPGARMRLVALVTPRD